MRRLDSVILSACAARPHTGSTDHTPNIHCALRLLAAAMSSAMSAAGVRNGSTSRPSPRTASSSSPIRRRPRLFPCFSPAPWQVIRFTRIHLCRSQSRPASSLDLRAQHHYLHPNGLTCVLIANPSTRFWGAAAAFFPPFKLAALAYLRNPRQPWRCT